MHCATAGLAKPATAMVNTRTATVADDRYILLVVIVVVAMVAMMMMLLTRAVQV